MEAARKIERHERQQVAAIAGSQGGHSYVDGRCPRCGHWKAITRPGNTTCACGQSLNYVIEETTPPAPAPEPAPAAAA